MTYREGCIMEEEKETSHYVTFTPVRWRYTCIYCGYSGTTKMHPLHNNIKCRECNRYLPEADWLSGKTNLSIWDDGSIRKDFKPIQVSAVEYIPEKGD